MRVQSVSVSESRCRTDDGVPLFFVLSVFVQAFCGVAEHRPKGEGSQDSINFLYVGIGTRSCVAFSFMGEGSPSGAWKGRVFRFPKRKMKKISRDLATDSVPSDFETKIQITVFRFVAGLAFFAVVSCKPDAKRANRRCWCLKLKKYSQV